MLYSVGSKMNSGAPTVTVITPFFQSAKFIERAVKSVLMQTFTDFELILVNDASTDGGGDICKALAESDERIVYLENQTRQGAGKSRKRALNAARGNFVAFLDGDDWYEPNMLETLFNEITKSDADVVCSAHFVNSGKKQKATFSGGERKTYTREQALEALNVIDGEISSMLWDKLFRRSSMADFDYDQEIVLGEDYTMLVKTFEKSDLIVWIGVPLYHYFMNPESVCNFGYTEKHAAAMRNYRDVVSYLSEKYPSVRKNASCYLTVQYMAAILSMTKNKNYDNRLIGELKPQIRANLGVMLKSRSYSAKYKFSALVASVSPKILLFFGRIRSFGAKRSGGKKTS